MSTEGEDDEASGFLLPDCFLGLICDHEDIGSMFLRNVGKLPPEYVVSKRPRSSLNERDNHGGHYEM
jgi:hypothetical protein